MVSCKNEKVEYSQVRRSLDSWNWVKDFKFILLISLKLMLLFRYNSLLSEVNEKRAQWKSSVSSRKILERLDETVTASEDSVFTSQSVIAEEITVVKRYVWLVFICLALYFSPGSMFIAEIFHSLVVLDSRDFVESVLCRHTTYLKHQTGLWWRGKRMHVHKTLWVN